MDEQKQQKSILQGKQCFVHYWTKGIADLQITWLDLLFFDKKFEDTKRENNNKYFIFLNTIHNKNNNRENSNALPNKFCNDGKNQMSAALARTIAKIEEKDIFSQQKKKLKKDI